MNLTGDLAIIAESEVLPTHGSTFNSVGDLVLWFSGTCQIQLFLA